MSASIIDQSRFLVNTSMVTGKSIQEMEIKIDKLNKKIDQYKKDYSFKDKIVAKLQKKKDLLAKLNKQRSEFDKSLTKTKAKLDNANQTIQDFKAYAIVIEGQKVKQVEAKLQIIIAAKKVLSDDNSKLLLLIKGFQKSLVEKVKERMVTLSHLHLLKEQKLQAIK